MVAIIFIGDIKYCPYLNIYSAILQEAGVDYDFLFWNRTNNDCTELPDNYKAYQRSSRLKKNRLCKLKDFMGYRLWLKNRIFEKEYDKLILLSTLSGIILADIILKHYKEKYIFDIRDYSYEKIYPFYKIEERLLNNSLLNCVSSAGFLKFLPKSAKYLPVHNIAGFDDRERYCFKKKEYGKTLNVVWNGAVRYFNHQKKLIEKLGNDKRFTLFYYGSGAEFDDYQSFLSDKTYCNVYLMGAYENSEKSKILENADLINSSYEFSIETKYAMPNKFYDGIIYKIPQLVETHTYKCMEVEKRNLGIGLDVNEKNFADKLYDYYFSINEDEFNSCCEKTLKGVLHENEFFSQQVYKNLIDKK